MSVQEQESKEQKKPRLDPYSTPIDMEKRPFHFALNERVHLQERKHSLR